MSPVLRHCARHGTFSKGYCASCQADKRDRQRMHSSRRGRRFRLAVLERDNWTCFECGKRADTVDYIVPLVMGGTPLDESNARAACRSCNSRRGAGIH